MRDTSTSTTLSLLLTFIALTSLPAAQGQSPGVDVLSTVFSTDLLPSTCFRIPSIVKTKNNVLVAFAERRYGSCSDGAVHAIAVRRSLDNGTTWSDVTNAVGGDSLYVGNPDPVYTKSGKIILIFVKHTAKCNGDCGVGNGMVVSSDDGATWSDPIDISKGFGAASGSLPGPGVSLQSSSGKILVVSHHSAYQRDYLTYSIDDGNTWNVSNHTFPAMDEAQMTQLTNGSLLLIMRHSDAKSNGKAISFSNDDGVTWSDIVYDKTLVTPVCQASVVTFGNTTYFSNPATTEGRFNISVKYSKDNAASWSDNILIESAPSAGYSCMVLGDVSGKGGILYEAVNMTIKFALFPLA